MSADHLPPAPAPGSKSGTAVRRYATALWQRIVACFLAGLFAVLPLAITVGIVIWVTAFVERFLGPGTFLGNGLRNLGIRLVGDGTGIVAYIVGCLIVLLTIFGLGLLMQLGAKRLFQRFLERSIRHVPLISTIYATSKQMVDLLDKDGTDTDLQGMSPVLCHFGDDSSPAVLALLASPDRYLVGTQEYQMVIIPTAPVPFGGALLMMPTQSIQPAPMTVDGLMSIYVSMGITASNFLRVAGR